MTTFGTPEAKWRAAAIAAIVVTVLTAGFQFAVPEPKVAEVEKRYLREQVKLQRELKGFETEITESRKDVESHLWEVEPDEIGAQAMATVDSAAVQSQVKVQAFRPQRTVTIDRITRYPYSVVVQGPFPKVVQLVRKLQDPGTNLAVTSVTLSAADGESDTVTSTIGLAVFSSSREEENGN